MESFCDKHQPDYYDMCPVCVLERLAETEDKLTAAEQRECDNCGCIRRAL